MSAPKFIELISGESFREYTFPGGDVVRIEDVARIAVSDSGTHRIETKNGQKHIVPTGWIHIMFNAASWTF
jgi:hypothetical protein